MGRRRSEPARRGLHEGHRPEGLPGHHSTVICPGTEAAPRKSHQPDFLRSHIDMAGPRGARGGGKCVWGVGGLARVFWGPILFLLRATNHPTPPPLPPSFPPAPPPPR